MGTGQLAAHSPPGGTAAGQVPGEGGNGLPVVAVREAEEGDGLQEPLLLLLLTLQEVLTLEQNDAIRGMDGTHRAGVARDGFGVPARGTSLHSSGSGDGEGKRPLFPLNLRKLIFPQKGAGPNTFGN